MQPRTRHVAACPPGHAARCSLCGALLLAVSTLISAASPLCGDTLTFLGVNGRYRYRAESTDNGWQVGDTITLSGLDQVTGATAPGGWTVAWTQYSVTWTCIQAKGGKPLLNIYATATPGESSYLIQSNAPASGVITGPAYVPEPTTVVMFCAGLMLLGSALRRRGLAGGARALQEARGGTSCDFNSWNGAGGGFVAAGVARGNLRERNRPMRTEQSVSTSTQQPVTAETAAGGCTIRGGLVVLLIGLLMAGAPGGPAWADTLSYLGQGGGTYWYLAEATDDLTWNVGEVVSLTGLDLVTGANEPFGFSAAYTPWAATWTCTEQFSGVAVFTVDSTAAVGQVSYTIVSGSGSSGTIEGPEYTPEPATVMMFSAGLFALVAVVWRRTRPS